MSHPSPPTPVTVLDAASDADAIELLRPTCASTRWLDEVRAGRPYETVPALRAAGERAVLGLSWPDVEQALAAHPRIGDRAEGAGQESAWSRQEQSATGAADECVRAELRAANQDYERQFGFIFLIYATGRSTSDMLAALRARLHNDEATERAVVCGELRAIVGLRLSKAFC
jgi:2-oxo-4-hydroxy-4-carboxy-5-ureidoimidazoline decarboxylase